MAYYCCFSLGGNLDFPDFLQKKFYIIDWDVFLYFYIINAYMYTFKLIDILPS